ncbi:MAG: hypothetical protein CSA49_06860 [Gammaproteobacteria bacterium]|nr:MAG: hypothetical protein CSA49_06860 [Gammaproteobacteria bacterium]
MRLMVIAVALALIALIAGGLIRLGQQADSMVPDALNKSGVMESLSATAVSGPVTAAKAVTDKQWIAPLISYESYTSVYGELPASLQGSMIPFNLEVAADGTLVVNQQSRRLFDYFFTLDGEEPVETILERVKELLETYLPESARVRAENILEQYFKLKLGEIELAHRLDAEFEASGRRPDAAELKQAIKDLRTSSLDTDVYTAFFGVEDQRDDYSLSRLEIQQDTSLTAAERQQALLEIEQLLPDKDRLQLQKERIVENTFNDVQQARDAGASDNEIFYIREQAFGAKVAQRYAEADVRKAQWESRIAAYRQEREVILNSSGMTDEDKHYQIELLRQEHFEGNELKRIPVIDRIKDAEQ